MKNAKKVLVAGLAFTLLLSTGLTTVDANGHNQKNSKQKSDMNKNGIADAWEKKYKLSGKNVAQQDKDKDGLTNLVEYKLNLNPTSTDTNKNTVPDGLEDPDKDKLSNLVEVELGTNPIDSDTDDDKVKDGNEKDKNGVAFSDLIREFEMEIQTADDKLKVEYKFKKGKSFIKVSDKTITKEMVESLVRELGTASNLNNEKLLAIIESALGLEGPYNLEAEVEFSGGKEVDVEIELNDEDKDEDDRDNNNNDDDENHDDGKYQWDKDDKYQWNKK